MRGLIFTEFVDMVEARFSLEIADAMLTGSNLQSGGIYTAAGSYDHRELHELLARLAGLTNRSADDLQRMFGRHMFSRLAERYSSVVRPYRSCFALLANLNKLMRAQVLVHGDAALPSFEHIVLESGQMRLVYRSRRGLAAYAHGLIEGCADFFGERILVERTDSTEADSACFLLTTQPTI